MNNVKPLTIGEVARCAGVGVETVRFYERKGLIDEPPRTESGYRQYSGDAVDRVKLILQAKELGFSLREILNGLLEACCGEDNLESCPVLTSLGFAGRKKSGSIQFNNRITT